MDELHRVLKQIQDLRSYNPDYSVPEGWLTGWEYALSALETWTKARISAIYRNSDRRPY